MMAQESHSTQTLMERDVLYPSEPETEENVILGYDEAQPQPEVLTATMALDILFDSYAAFVNNPDRPTRKILGEPSYEDIIDGKRSQLSFYVKTAFEQGDIAIDPKLFQSEKSVTIDDIIEAYVSESIIRAHARQDEAGYDPVSAALPEHVQAVQSAEEVDTKPNAFIEQVKHIGAKAMKIITLHSTEVTLPPTRVLPVPEAIEEK